MVTSTAHRRQDALEAGAGAASRYIVAVWSNEQRLSAAEETANEGTSATWRRINLVGLNRRSVVAGRGCEWAV